MVSRFRVFAAILELTVASVSMGVAQTGTAHAETVSSSVLITDATGDVTDWNGAVLNEFPELDISTASALYKDGRITLGLTTGHAPDGLLHWDWGIPLAMWGLWTASTDVASPDYVVFFAKSEDYRWTVIVVRGDDSVGENICPTGTSAAYDHRKAQFTATLNASCIGSPASFKFQASRLELIESGLAGDLAPDGTRLAGPVAAGRSHGYWMVGADGKVHNFGDAAKATCLSKGGAGYDGDPGPVAAPVVDLEPTPDGNGYWIVDEQGHVYGCGAPPFGNVDPSKLASGEKVTSLSATPKGDGYWIFTSKGRALTFGAAELFGDMSAKTLNGPVLDSVATPSGKGYYMVASDGGVFAFGDAAFEGSMGNKKLNKPVQSLVPDPDGEGYWLVASDGGIFSFAADFHGSMGDKTLNKPITGMVAFGNGYLMVGEDGGIFNFSDQPFDGSLGDKPPAQPIVSVAALPKRLS